MVVGAGAAVAAAGTGRPDAGRRTPRCLLAQAAQADKLIVSRFKLMQAKYVSVRAAAEQAFPNAREFMNGPFCVDSARTKAVWTKLIQWKTH
jgi:hypothetical protein